MLGWGAINLIFNCKTGGEWLPNEKQMHINYLALKAAHFALKSFCSQLQNTHVRLKIDNMTAVAYIREMGGGGGGGSKSVSCNEITKIIWEFTQTQNIWLSVSYIPGKLNIITDNQSRKFSAELEWKLDSDIFEQITGVLSKLSFKCDIDLFASRLNFQIAPYVSCKPDPDAYAVDAFTLTWSSFTFYAFPPFSIIPQVLQKVSQDRRLDYLLFPFGLPRLSFQVFYTC